MSDQRNGGIAWTDATWNPIRGCSRVSSGCINCYAEAQAARFCCEGMPFYDLIRKGRWTGVVRFIAEHLADPLHWRTPRRVFVNSMSDLFHPSVTNEQIAAIYGVMSACQQHTFQLLTKRPERAVEWYEWAEGQDAEVGPLRAMQEAICCIGAPLPGNWDREEGPPIPDVWPLPNLHLLVSCEDHTAAAERIPLLMKCPSAARGVSLEPLLGPIDLTHFVRDQLLPGNTWADCLCDEIDPSDRPCPPCYAQQGIDWVIVGCESGQHRRPCNTDWVISIVRQCREAGVACFVKQLDFGGKVSKNPEDWPEALRVRMFPGDRYQ
jgi:protein gp37